MKIKLRLRKKTKEVPDRLRKALYRTLRKSKSAFFRTHFVKTLRRYGRMEAIRALKLFFKFTHLQLQIRPRIRLIAAVVLILLISLAISTQAVDYVHERKGDVKINGQAILVAQNIEEKPAPVDIEASIQSKRSPFDFVKPVEGYVSQGYHGGHRAIDIATGAVGIPITALGEGKVDFAGFTADGKGNVVIVDHGDGLKSLYAHMGKISVGVGNQVDSGTLLGTVGLTGHTTGAHVHLEIYDNGIAVDPAKILPEPENPLGLEPRAELTPD